MATTLYIEATYGIAGDMLLGALVELGADLEGIVEMLSRALPPFTVESGHDTERGLRARRLAVTAREPSPPHRTLAAVTSIIETAGLPEATTRRALETFCLLATAEGRVHGVPAAQVHFHEVGALDSLVDVLGTLLAVEQLAPARIEVSSLPLGSGTVETAHGTSPVPAPATLELCRGLPTHPLPLGRELSTPTGVALARVLADGFGPPPAGQITAIGVAAGQRRATGSEPPNVLRAWLTEPALAGAGWQRLVLLETNVDHLSGEEAGDLVETLLACGALDAFLVPTIQKKSRPGLLITVLAAPDRAAALEELLVRHSGTLGLRRTAVERRALERAFHTVEVLGHPVRIKCGGPRPGDWTSVRPEHEDLRVVAAATGLPLRELRDRALAAWQARHGWREGRVEPGDQGGVEGEGEGEGDDGQIRNSTE